MAKLPQRLAWDLAQTKWASEIEPFLNKPIVNGLLLSNVRLINGVTVINHLLGRKQIGYIITDIDGAATIYRSAPLNNLTLTLTSNAACNVSIWVF